MLSPSSSTGYGIFSSATNLPAAACGLGPSGLVAFLQVVAFRVHAQNLKALRRVLVAQLDDPRRFNPAGTAPRGPEVDQHSLAPVARERDFFAAQIFKRKGRRGLAVERRDVFRRAASGSGHQLALPGAGQQPLGRLPAILPVGPPRPGKDGQNQKRQRPEPECCAARGRTSWVYCTRRGRGSGLRSRVGSAEANSGSRKDSEPAMIGAQFHEMPSALGHSATTPLPVT